MKKKNIVRIIIIALFVIGIAAALMQYKREQTALEQPEVGEEPETVVLSADENPFGIEIKKINEDYDLTRNYYKDYDNTGLQKYIIPVIFNPVIIIRFIINYLFKINISFWPKTRFFCLFKKFITL